MLSSFVQAWALCLEWSLRGGVDDFYFFDCFKSVSFFVNWFHCIFSISNKILTNYLYYYCILMKIVWAVGTSFFLSASFTSFHTHASLLAFFVCFVISFHSCFPCASVWENTFARVPYFLLTYWMMLSFFRQFNYKCTMCIRSEKLKMVKHL